MKTSKDFPNGFESWAETHFEISILLNNNDAVQERYGMGGTWEFSQQLTDEFETLHEGREWDGEWFDEIETFMSNKINEKI